MPDDDQLIDDVELADEDTPEDDLEHLIEAAVSPDEFYAKHAFRVVYQTNNFMLPQIRDLIKGRQVINIRPEYQRRLRWGNSQKSRLIESFLLNIPIPSVFFYEGEAARYEVMDGQQRLNAIKEFIENEFRLSSLTVLWPLNGMRYSDLPPRIKRGLDRAVVSAIVLLLESDVEQVRGKDVSHSDIRRFIFERLNTAGTRLNAQELRNAIYPGNFNDLILEIARDHLFTKIWDIPGYVESDPNEYYENPKRQKNTLYASMMDCQIVLRFFALRDAENIRGSMKGILDRTMDKHKSMSKEEADQAKSMYLSRLEAANTLFGGKPFELPADHKGKVRLSVALQDAVMVALDRLWAERDQLLTAAPAIRSSILALLSNTETATVLTGQGNTAQSTKDRINLVERTFSETVSG
jgi:hypothetical protein